MSHREERRLWAVGESRTSSRRAVAIFDFIVSGVDPERFRREKKAGKEKEKAFSVGVTLGRHKGWGKRGRLVGDAVSLTWASGYGFGQISTGPQKAGRGDARRCRPEATPTGWWGEARERRGKKERRFLSRSPWAGIRAEANEAGSLAGRSRRPGQADMGSTKYQPARKRQAGAGRGDAGPRRPRRGGGGEKNNAIVSHREERRPRRRRKAGPCSAAPWRSSISWPPASSAGDLLLTGA